MTGAPIETEGEGVRLGRDPWVALAPPGMRYRDKAPWVSPEHAPLDRRAAEVREPFLAAMGFNGSEFAASDDLFDPLALVRSRGSGKEPG